MPLLCSLLGHGSLRDLDVNEREATCARCGRRLHVSYDMAYGETIVVGEVAP